MEVKWKRHMRDNGFVLFFFYTLQEHFLYSDKKLRYFAFTGFFFSCRYRLLNATGCHLYCLHVWKNENTCIIYNPVISLKGSPSLNLTSIPSLCLSCLTIILFSFFFHWVKHSLFPKINSCWSFKHPEAQ